MGLPLLLLLTLSGCTTTPDTDETPTAPAGVTETPTAGDLTVTVSGTIPAAELSEANGQTITDGICRALIPDGWVDDGTGRGTTSGGHRFVLFGGRVRSDAEWQSAVNLVATPRAGRTVESSDQTGDSIFAVFADDRGFEYRQRFGDRYCDLTVTADRPISEEEQSFWPAIAESLQPA